MPKAPKPWFRAGRGWFAWVDRKQIPLGGIDATFKQAEQALARIRSSPKNVVAHKLTVVEVCELYCRAKINKLKPDTLRSYQKQLQEFCGKFGSQKAWKLTLVDFVAWVESHKTWNDSTRRLVMTIVKAVFAWAKKGKLVPENPLLGIELPDMGVREVMSEEESRRFMAAIRSRPVQELVTALCETGARPGEIAGVTAASLDRDQRTVAVCGKTGKRIVALNDAAYALMSRLAEQRPDGPLFRTARGRRWNKDLMYNSFKRIRARTGIENATPYGFRHLFATAACRNNVNPFVLATLMGHKDTKMIHKVYAKHSTETLRAAAEQVHGRNTKGPAHD